MRERGREGGEERSREGGREGRERGREERREGGRGGGEEGGRKRREGGEEGGREEEEYLWYEWCVEVYRTYLVYCKLLSCICDNIHSASGLQRPAIAVLEKFS